MIHYLVYPPLANKVQSGAKVKSVRVLLCKLNLTHSHCGRIYLVWQGESVAESLNRPIGELGLDPISRADSLLLTAAESLRFPFEFRCENLCKW